MKKLIIELPDEANMVALAAVSVKPGGAVAKLMVHYQKCKPMVR